MPHNQGVPGSSPGGTTESTCISNAGAFSVLALLLQVVDDILGGDAFYFGESKPFLSKVFY